MRLSCVLFDLDGTLVDTAPDLIACLNLALIEHEYSAVDADSVKPFISLGAMAMINASITASEQQKLLLLDTMLSCYEQNIAKYTVFFDGMEQTLNTIETMGLKWGVVTNKRERFTHPLMDALNLTQRAACVISGDTAEYPKPHPAPMLAACQQVQVQPEHCVYIGDAAHDITAGKAANMKTLAAVYGYLKPTDQPETWGADELIASPAHLLAWIQNSLC